MVPPRPLALLRSRAQGCLHCPPILHCTLLVILMLRTLPLTPQPLQLTKSPRRRRYAYAKPPRRGSPLQRDAALESEGCRDHGAASGGPSTFCFGVCTEGSPRSCMDECGLPPACRSATQLGSASPARPTWSDCSFERQLAPKPDPLWVGAEWAGGLCGMLLP